MCGSIQESDPIQWPKLFCTERHLSFKTDLKSLEHHATELKVIRHKRRQTGALEPWTRSCTNPAPKLNLGYKAGHRNKLLICHLGLSKISHDLVHTDTQSFKHRVFCFLTGQRSYASPKTPSIDDHFAHTAVRSRNTRSEYSTHTALQATLSMRTKTPQSSQQSLDKEQPHGRRPHIKTQAQSLLGYKQCHK